MNVLTLTRTHGVPETASQAHGPLELMKAARRYDPSIRFMWGQMRSMEQYAEEYQVPGIDPVYILPSVNNARWLGFRMDEATWLAIEKSDIVLSNQLGLTELLVSSGKPVLNLQMWNVMPPKALRARYGIAPLPEEMYQEALGTLLAPNVWESTVQRESTLGLLGSVLSIDGLSLIDQGAVLPLGVNVEELELGRPTQTGLFWTGKVAEPHKGWHESLEIMRGVVSATGCEAHATTIEVEQVATPAWLRMMWGATRSVYFETMSKSSVFVSNCSWESYGLAWLEMLGAGLLGVYQRYPWVETILPDWYPFVVDDPDDQRDLAIALIRQWPDGDLWRYRSRVQAWVREEHSLEQSGPNLVAALRRYA